MNYPLWSRTWPCERWHLIITQSTVKKQKYSCNSNIRYFLYNFDLLWSECERIFYFLEITDKDLRRNTKEIRVMWREVMARDIKIYPSCIFFLSKEMISKWPNKKCAQCGDLYSIHLENTVKLSKCVCWRALYPCTCKELPSLYEPVLWKPFLLTYLTSF